MTGHNDTPLTATRASSHHASTTKPRTANRTSPISWLARRLRRKLRWVLIGLAVVYLVGTLGALRDCKHQLDHHTPQVTDGE